MREWESRGGPPAPTRLLRLVFLGGGWRLDSGCGGGGGVQWLGKARREERKVRMMSRDYPPPHRPLVQGDSELTKEPVRVAAPSEFSAPR